MGLAARYRGIKVKHFGEETRQRPRIRRIRQEAHHHGPAGDRRLYPRLRPARVTVTTPRGIFVRQADEALGSRIVPLDDTGLKAKFVGLVAPAFGGAKAKVLSEQLWNVDRLDDVSPLIEALAK